MKCRIFVAVRNRQLWSRLYDMRIDPAWGLPGHFGIELFGGIPDTAWSFGVEDSWECVSGPESFACEIHQRLKGLCFISADCVSESVPEKCRIFCSFDSYESHRFAPCPPVDIRNPELWLHHADIQLTDRHLRFLSEFGAPFDYILRRSPVTECRSRMFLAFRDCGTAARFIALRFFDDCSACPVSFSEITQIRPDCTLTLMDCAVLRNHDTLQKFTDILSAELGDENFALFADAADPSLSPFWNAVLVLGGQAEWKERYTDLSAVPIDAPQRWMSLAHFRLTPQRKAFLSVFPASAFDFTR